MPVRRAAALAAALLAAAALAGCAGAPEPSPVTVTITSEAQQPTPTPTPTATPTAVPSPPAAVIVAPTLIPNAPAPEPTPRPWGPAYDNGPIPGAQGAPVLDDAGNPVSYTVIEGDSFFDIAQRFDLPQQQLLSINPSVPGIGEDIYIGNVINLDWTTKR